MKSLLLSLAFAGIAAAAVAGPSREALVAQLRAQGFTEIEVKRTLLGRERIIAESPTHKREIVINPATGLILRDHWEREDDDDDDDAGVLLDPHHETDDGAKDD